MEKITEVLNPYFVAAIIALTEMLKTFLPKLNHRLVTVIATIAVAIGYYLGFGFDAVETAINTLSGILTSAGIYSLTIKPFKKKEDL
jgi:hypothetical protein